MLGIDLPLIGGDNEDAPSNGQAESSDKSGAGGLLGGLGGGVGRLLDSDSSGGGLPDMFGLGGLLDKGMDWVNDAGVDKYIGGAAGAAAGTMCLGPMGTSAGWELGKAAGDKGGDVASGLNLFSAGQEKA